MAGEMLCGACVVRVFVSVGLCGAGLVCCAATAASAKSHGVCFGGRCTNVWPRGHIMVSMECGGCAYEVERRYTRFFL